MKDYCCHEAWGVDGRRPNRPLVTLLKQDAAGGTAGQQGLMGIPEGGGAAGCLTTLEKCFHVYLMKVKITLASKPLHSVSDPSFCKNLKILQVESYVEVFSGSS